MRSNPNAFTQYQKEDVTDIVGDVSHIYNQINHGYVTAIDIRDYIKLVQEKLENLYESIDFHLTQTNNETLVSPERSTRTLNTTK